MKKPLYNIEFVKQLRDNPHLRKNNGRMPLESYHRKLFGNEQSLNPMYYVNEDNFPYDDTTGLYEDIVIINGSLYLEVIDVQILSVNRSAVRLYFGILRSFTDHRFSSTPAYWHCNKGQWSRVRFVGKDKPLPPIPEIRRELHEAVMAAFENEEFENKPVVAEEPKSDNDDWGKAIEWHQLKI